MMLPTICTKEGVWQNSPGAKTLKISFYVKKATLNFELIKYIPLPTLKIAFY